MLCQVCIKEVTKMSSLLTKPQGVKGDTAGQTILGTATGAGGHPWNRQWSGGSGTSIPFCFAFPGYRTKIRACSHSHLEGILMLPIGVCSSRWPWYLNYNGLFICPEGIFPGGSFFPSCSETCPLLTLIPHLILQFICGICTLNMTLSGQRTFGRPEVK